MRQITQFIQDNTEEILDEWDRFARSLAPAADMDMAALRDHAKEMLGVIGRDLETSQTAGEQSSKAQGKTDAVERGDPSTAAQEHGAARAVSGFTVAEMISELRALRASVIRLWMKQKGQLQPADLEDMIRFNEAIDQAIAESVTQHSEQLNQTKDRFLAILGHDLRNPLGAIIMSAASMMEFGELSEPSHKMAAVIDRSARRMNGMVSDLLDFTRTQLGGGGIPITPTQMDAAKLVHDVATEVGTRYPKSTVKVETSGELAGMWDPDRLTQAITNLVTNAVQHGAKSSLITVTARGTDEEIVIAVHNEGDAIPEDGQKQIFKMGAQGQPNSRADDEHLGLGLFIVDRIIAAHHGTIEVRSTEQAGTAFTVHLPRNGSG